MTFGERLRELRKNQGLTQEQLADKVELSLDMVKSLEQGRKTPSLETLTKLAELFGCTTDYLLGFSENKISKKTQQLMDEFEYLDESFITMKTALQKIANGCDNPQEVAKEALKEIGG